MRFAIPSDFLLGVSAPWWKQTLSKQIWAGMLLLSVLFTVLTFAQDSASIQNDSTDPLRASAQKTDTNIESRYTYGASQLDPVLVIQFVDQISFHNMSITSNGSLYHTINGGNAQSGEINNYDLNGNFVSNVAVILDARAILYNPTNGNVYIKTFTRDWYEVDPSTGSFNLIFSGIFAFSQSSPTLSLDGTKIYEHESGTVHVFDANTGTLLNTMTGFQFGSYPSSEAITTDGTFLYTWDGNTVFQYDLTGNFVDSFVLPFGNYGFSLSYANGLLWASDDGSNTWYGYSLDQGVPDITVNPSSFIFNLPAGGMGNATMTIGNVGNSDLNWSISEQEFKYRPGAGRSAGTGNNLHDERSAVPARVKEGTTHGSSSQFVDQPEASKPTSMRFANSPSLVAVFQVQDPWGSSAARDILTANGISFDIYGVADIGSIDLSPYDKVVTSSVQGSAFWSALSSNRTWFENYVSGGGVLEMHLAMFSGSNLPGLPLPGGFVTSNFQAFEDVNIIAAGHPVVSTPNLVSDSDLDGWNHSSHGFFTSVPANANIIIENIDGSTACAESVLGSGSIIATLQTVEWFDASSAYLENMLLYDGPNGGGDCPWLSQNLTSGTVTPGSSQSVQLFADAGGLAPGSYNCSLVISSNDPDENPFTVPVELIVQSGQTDEFAVVTNDNDRTLSIIDTNLDVVFGPFLAGSLGTGDLLDVVVTPDGQKALASNFGDQTVFFIGLTNPTTPSLLGSINIGFSAEDISLTPNGALALVADGASSTLLAVIDVTTQTLINTIDLAPREMQAVAISPDGQTVLAADFDADLIHVLLIDQNTGAVNDLGTSIPVDAGPLNIAFSPDGQTALVANWSVSSLSVLHITAPGVVSVSNTIPNVAQPQSIAFSHDGNEAYVVETGASPDQLAVLSVTGPGNVSDTGMRVPLSVDVTGAYFGVDALAVTGDDNKAYVGNAGISGGVNNLSVVDLNSLVVINSLITGSNPTGLAIGGADGGPDCLCGDINGDGVVNSTDCLIILSYDVGIPIPPDFEDRIDQGCGDINQDGLTNSTDALICLSFDAGLPVPFPVGQPGGCGL